MVQVPSVGPSRGDLLTGEGLQFSGGSCRGWTCCLVWSGTWTPVSRVSKSSDSYCDSCTLLVHSPPVCHCLTPQGTLGVRRGNSYFYYCDYITIELLDAHVKHVHNIQLHKTFLFINYCLSEVIHPLNFSWNLSEKQKWPDYRNSVSWCLHLLFLCQTEAGRKHKEKTPAGPFSSFHSNRMIRNVQTELFLKCSAKNRRPHENTPCADEDHAMWSRAPEQTPNGS